MEVKPQVNVPTNLPINDAPKATHKFTSPISGKNFLITYSGNATKTDLKELERLMVEYTENPSKSPSPSEELKGLMSKLNICTQSWDTIKENTDTFCLVFSGFQVSEAKVEEITSELKQRLSRLIQDKSARGLSLESYSKLVKEHSDSQFELSLLSLSACTYLGAVKLFVTTSKENNFLDPEQQRVCDEFLSCCEAHFIEQIPEKSCSTADVRKALNLQIRNKTLQSITPHKHSSMFIEFATICDKLERGYISFYGSISQPCASDLSKILTSIGLPVRELQAYRGQISVALSRAGIELESYDTLQSTRQYSNCKIIITRKNDCDNRAYPDAITASGVNPLYISAQLTPIEILDIARTQTNVALLQVGKTPQKFLNNLATHSEVYPDETYLCGYQKLCVANFTKYNENDIDNPVLLFLFVPAARITTLLEKITDKYKVGDPVLARPPLESATDEEKTPPTQSST